MVAESGGLYQGYLLFIREIVIVDTRDYFISSLELEMHPIKNFKPKIQQEYYDVLSHFVGQVELNVIAKYRLEQYKKLLVKEELQNRNTKIEDKINSIFICRFRPWRKKYRYWLMCDVALILLEWKEIQKVVDSMCSYLTKGQQKKLELLLMALKDDKLEFSEVDVDDLLLQYRTNAKFLEKKEKRFIVTANMSAGKSTLINALIGKSLTRTSQEVCTGNICYLYNKAFDDKRVHLETSQLNLDATQNELRSFLWDSAIYIGAYFKGMQVIEDRLCIIDTPGVNSAINRNHGRITHEALKTESYEKVIYVLNANKLGTDEEISYLKWISENIPKDKVIFVVNKLDDFNSKDDNIHMSIAEIRNDLWELGYDNPMICPISAYFALLIKMRKNGDEMSEDELDEYTYFSKKFNKPIYNLISYYKNVEEDVNDDENLSMSKKCGLYGLEKILFGGTL